jgi:uncharacterized membrane protein YeaQ/YmgE (transglycosylase-associated protein family)
MLQVLGWLIVGFVVGLLARWVTPGNGPRGFLWTSLCGIAGSAIGGSIAKANGLPTNGGGGFLMAILGAVLVITAAQLLGRLLRRRER